MHTNRPENASPADVRFLEDFQVGDCAESPPYTVTGQEVIQFAQAWDPQPFHVDEAFAAQTMFGGLIACSAHIFAVFCKLSNQIEPRSAALAGLGFDEVRIPKPVRAGDTLRLFSRCLTVRRSASKPDRGIVASQVELKNQNGEVVFSTIAKALVQARS